jgi:hypothetical protein
MLGFTIKLTKCRNIFRFVEKKCICMISKKDSKKAFELKVNEKESLFKYDKSYPGTAPPGTVEENFPLSEVLNLKINNSNVQEFSRDQQCGVIRGADESILDWLEKKGKIKPRIFDDTKEEIVEKNQTLLEDEFDFEDGEDALENFFGQPGSNLSDFV